MSEDRLSRLEGLIEANTLANQQLNESLNFLVSEFIRPTTQQAFANYERLERLESALETLVAQSLINAEQIEATRNLCETNAEQIEATRNLCETNAEQIEATRNLCEMNAEQIEATRNLCEANQQQIARNTENITKLGAKISEQSEQIQVLIEEGRADRQAQREALAAILSIDSRVDVLERKVS